MGHYKNIEVDFVERTKENLEFLEKNNVNLPQEITHLLNYCYGLIVLPEQKMNNIISLMPQDLSYYGIKEGDVTTNNPKTFENVIRSLRNGFAHAHLQSLTDEKGKDFIALAIKDYAREKDVINDTPHTTIELSLEQLKSFILKFSQEYIACKRKIEQKL